MRILFFGDIVGRPGRTGIKSLLPQLQEEFSPDLVIANVENMAHGYGITPETIVEMQDAGVHVFTLGNHAWKNAQGVQLLQGNPSSIARPANTPSQDIPGRSFVETEINGKRVVVLNLLGRVMMPDEATSPFDYFDAFYEEQSLEDAIVIVDLHAEATGEKRIFGWHVNGRASVVVGTHTHVPTADQQILPEGGTGYVTDLGMVGARNSSIGMEKSLVRKKVIEELPVNLEPPVDVEEVEVGSVLFDIDEATGNTTHIERIDRIIGV